MKKFLWIAALLALALIFIGCPNGDPKTEEDEEEEPEELLGEAVEPADAWWVAPSAAQWERKMPDNRIPVIGQEDDASSVHIYFRPHGVNLPDNRNFTITVKFIYESEENFPLNFMWQCGFDPYGTWARSSSNDDYLALVNPGNPVTAVCQPLRMFSGGNWDETKLGNGKTGLTTSEMRGLCIQVPIEYTYNAGSVQVTDVIFGKIAGSAGGNITGPHPLES
jgi:hypothetical protein